MHAYAMAVPTAGHLCQLLLRSQLFACSREAQARMPNLASTLQVRAPNTARQISRFNGAQFMRVRISMFLAVLALGLSALSARAEQVVRYGISMAHTALTTGQPDRSAGPSQFSTYPIHDAQLSRETDVSHRL